MVSSHMVADVSKYVDRIIPMYDIVIIPQNIELNNVIINVIINKWGCAIGKSI